MSDTKHCPACKQTLLLAAFYTVKRPQGLRTSGYCRMCTKARAIAWMQAQSPEWHAAKAQRDQARLKGTPEKRAAHSAYMTQYHRAARAKDAASYRAKEKAWRESTKAKDPERYRMRTACSNNHNRAKMKGLPSSFGVRDWEAALVAFDNTCAYCGAKNARLDLDHFVSMNHGGANVPSNVVPACRPCNAEKARRTLEEFTAVARISPARVQWIRDVLAYLASPARGE